jgi:hypothetical protein
MYRKLQNSLAFPYGTGIFVYNLKFDLINVDNEIVYEYPQRPRQRKCQNKVPHGSKLNYG